VRQVLHGIPTVTFDEVPTQATVDFFQDDLVLESVQ